MAAARGRAAHRFLEVVGPSAPEDEARDLATRFLREEGIEAERQYEVEEAVRRAFRVGPPRGARKTREGGVLEKLRGRPEGWGE